MKKEITSESEFIEFIRQAEQDRHFQLSEVWKNTILDLWKHGLTPHGVHILFDTIINQNNNM